MSWAQKADAWLSELNAQHETHLYDMGHEITAEEVDNFVRWLQPVLNIA